MAQGLRQLLHMLLVFAVIGSMTGQLTRSAQQMAPTAAAMPCAMEMTSMGHAHAKPAMPCKAMNCDCVKQMGVASVAVPVRLSGIEPAMHVARAGYWPGHAGLTGFIAPPEPLPPRTI